MKKNILYTAISILLIVLSSCEEKIDLNLETTYPRLVVDADFTNEISKKTIYLYQSTDYYDINLPPPVANATIQVSDGSNIFTFSQEGNYLGKYVSDTSFGCIPGLTYEINISDIDINGDGKKEIYSATSYMPDTVHLDSITIGTFDFFGAYTGWQVDLYAWEPAGKNYYMFKTYRNGVLLSDTITDAFYSDDQFFDGNYMDGITVSMHSDENIHDTISIGDTITLEFSSLNKEYYRFHYELITTVNSSAGAFSMVASNPTNNFNSEMVMGYFNTRAVTYVSKIYEE
jgi:hypothetical protein